MAHTTHTTQTGFSTQTGLSGNITNSSQIASTGYVTNAVLCGNVTGTNNTYYGYGYNTNGNNTFVDYNSLSNNSGIIFTPNGTSNPYYDYLAAYSQNLAWSAPENNTSDGSIKQIFQVQKNFVNSSFTQKHLSVWRFCNPPWDEDKYLHENMDSPYGSVGNLNFYSFEEAQKFNDWWNRYVSFFDENSWTMSYYPTLKKGYVKGVYVETNCKTLDEKFEQWKWIVKNTVGGAAELNNGWIFNLETDASLFILTFKD